MLLSSIFQTLKAQMLANAKSPEHMDYKYSYSDDHILTCPRSYSALGNTRMFNKLTKVCLHI